MAPLSRVCPACLEQGPEDAAGPSGRNRAPNLRLLVNRLLTGRQAIQNCTKVTFWSSGDAGPSGDGAPRRQAQQTRRRPGPKVPDSSQSFVSRVLTLFLIQQPLCEAKHICDSPYHPREKPISRPASHTCWPRQ